MKIHHKITLVSSTLFGLIFLISAIAIYTAFFNSSKQLFHTELARTAQIAGMFYLEKDELTKSQYQPIEKAFYNLSKDQRISIYDEQDSIAFDTEQSMDAVVAQKLNDIRQKGSLNFKRGLDYYHGLFYEDNQGDFVVLVKAESPLIQSQLEYLAIILISSFILGMIILVILTSRLSRLAYSPVRHTIKQVAHLDLNKRPLRLEYRSTKDDLDELFEAFNSLLKEIEQTYDQQKNFVDYASHELKTPLAGIINHLEVSLQRQRSSQEYQDTTRVVLSEAERLREILKNLLTFSSLNRVIHQKNSIRIDELVWNVIEQLGKKYDESRFHVKVEVQPSYMEVLQFNGNETLLAIGLYNLMDNAAKFSGDAPVSLKLYRQENILVIELQDRGIGISPEELKKVTQAFYRAENAGNFKGSGLGLSIALRILELHNIDIDLQSDGSSGTFIKLFFNP